jgi:lysyl-tRNA synthetase class 2
VERHLGCTARTEQEAQTTDATDGEKFMKEIPLNSSALLGYTYDPQRQWLWIRFRTGERYLYQMVPADVVEALIQASSQGQYFNSVIRPHFSFERLWADAHVGDRPPGRSFPKLAQLFDCCGTKPGGRVAPSPKKY